MRNKLIITIIFMLLAVSASVNAKTTTSVAIDYLGSYNLDNTNNTAEVLNVYNDGGYVYVPKGIEVNNVCYVVNKINKNTFNNAKDIEYIFIDSKLNGIDKYLFNNLNNVKSITLQAIPNNAYIRKQAFRNINKQCIIYVPNIKIKNKILKKNIEIKKKNISIID